jgi:integrase
MASITKTNTGTYSVRYRTPTAKQRRRTFQRRTDAERFARETETAKDRGTYTDPQRGQTRWEDWIDQWQTTRHNRPTTEARDNSYIKNHIRPAFQHKTLVTIEPSDIRTWINTLITHGYAPGTIIKLHQMAAAALDQAVTDGYLATTPSRNIALPRNEKTDRTYLTPDQIATLAETIHPQFRALVLTAGYTGLRAGELTGLRITDLDLLRRRLTVRQTLTNAQGHLSFGPPKTAASRRTVSLPQGICDLLAAHLTQFPSDDLVFTTTQGHPIRWTNFRRRYWKPALVAAELPDVRFHDLRHSHASILIAQGTHPKVISSRLGHSSIGITMDTYGHLFDGLDEGAGDALDAVFSEAAVPDVCHSDNIGVIELSG